MDGRGEEMFDQGFLGKYLPGAKRVQKKPHLCSNETFKRARARKLSGDASVVTGLSLGEPA